MNRIPSIAKVMTPFPYSIDLNDDIVSAKLMMSDHQIRHLPVTDEGRVVGLLADSDIRAAGGVFATEGTCNLPVRSVCSMRAFVVQRSAPLDPGQHLAAGGTRAPNGMRGLAGATPFA